VEHDRIIGDALSSKPLLDAVAATRQTATGKLDAG
jgi:hypothetical protein